MRGLFASFNNPAQEYREQAYWDGATGIKNKNGYQKQLQIMEKMNTKKNIKVGFLIGDMNGLKVINDNLKSAYDIYRVGGDEFVAIYISPKDELVEAVVNSVMSACEAYKDSPITLSIAMGYASGDYSADYIDIYNKADSIMYVNKVEIKKKHPELCGR